MHLQLKAINTNVLVLHPDYMAFEQKILPPSATQYVGSPTIKYINQSSPAPIMLALIIPSKATHVTNELSKDRALLNDKVVALRYKLQVDLQFHRFPIKTKSPLKPSNKLEIFSRKCGL